MLCVLIRIASSRRILISIPNIQLLSRRSKKILNYRHLFPDLAPWLILSGSNYPYFEQCPWSQRCSSHWGSTVPRFTITFCGVWPIWIYTVCHPSSSCLDTSTASKMNCFIIIQFYFILLGIMETTLVSWKIAFRSSVLESYATLQSNCWHMKSLNTTITLSWLCWDTSYGNFLKRSLK